MYWRSEKEIVEEFTGILRRVFSYVEELPNKDRELINLPTESLKDAIYEAHASDSEKYPQIRVSSGGIRFVNTLNNFISQIEGEEEYLGTRPLKSVIVSKQSPLKIKLPSELTGTSARGLSVAFASIDYMGGDNVDIKIYKHYLSSPILEASGTLLGNPSSQYLLNFAEFSNTINITDEDYWLELIPQEDSKYMFGIDTTINSKYKYYEDSSEIEATGSLHGSMVAPAFSRIGAMLQGPIIVTCSAKDDSGTASNLSTVVGVYCNLLKEAQIDRKNTAIDKTKFTLFSRVEIDDWLSKGIRIESIVINPIVKRQRSTQDIIYESSVVINVMTEWFQDFPAVTLENIDIDIRSILPLDFQTLNITINRGL
ncbi:MAG: hypothetical protein WC346_06430 [Methanogenium sp.]|jgi:hypothetical protein